MRLRAFDWQRINYSDVGSIIMRYQEAPRLGTGQKYAIRAMNSSTNSGSFCIFQQDPNLGVSGALPVVWFSKYVHPQTAVRFDWTTDYNFVWSETGLLSPGVDFDASQVFDADLQGLNQITLTYIGGAYTFSNQGKGPKPGPLYIREDASIPLKKASVGIGMSGSATFVVQAQPNLSLNFTPLPRYYIAFGDYTQGEALALPEMTNTAEIAFPQNIYSMAAILNADNSWTVDSTLSMNKSLVEARASGSNLTLTFADMARLLRGRQAGGSLTSVWVFDPDNIVVFANKHAIGKEKGILVQSRQPPRKTLDGKAIYKIAGKSGETRFGPIGARYVDKSGNTYKFRQD
jgi:hypothetical protein